MKTLEIIGDNYQGKYHRVRYAARGIVLKDNEILLSYASKEDLLMIPGGGMEQGETPEECCIREVMEETGFITDTSDCKLIINEYYGDELYTTYYFICSFKGRSDVKMTEEEQKVKMYPVFKDVNETVSEFSDHKKYDKENEMKAGLYLREYTALKDILNDIL